MNYKKFARTEHNLSQLGFGCWGIGKSMWIGAEDTESKRALHRSIETGINFFDSALVYGNGHSEKLVGEVEKESGQTLFIATKIPSRKFEWPAYDRSSLKDSFPADWIIKNTEKSLKNLNRDYIDLQQFHVWNDNWAQEDEWKQAIDTLKRDGKVRYFGISINDHQPENGIEAGKTGYIDAYQVIFNIFDQSPIDRLFPFCLENNLSIIARVPFDEGSLAGAVRPDTVFPKGDFRNNYFRDDRKDQVWHRVQQIMAEVGTEAGSIAEAALRYVISFEAVTSVIPGMRTEKHLLANLDAVARGPLAPALINKLAEQRWVRNFYR